MLKAQLNQVMEQLSCADVYDLKDKLVKSWANTYSFSVRYF
jgi:hypothetical protein